MPLLSIDDFAERIGASRVSVYKALREGRIKGTKSGPSGGYQIDLETEAKAWEINRKNPNKIPHNIRGGRPRKDGKPPAEPKTQPRAEPPASEPPELDERSMNQIQRAREIVKLQLDELKLKEASGELVSAAEVQKQGRSLATGIISSLYNIPERCSDEIAGMSDPHAIHKMLTSEIDVAVEAIRKMYVNPQ